VDWSAGLIGNDTHQGKHHGQPSENVGFNKGSTTTGGHPSRLRQLLGVGSLGVASYTSDAAATHGWLPMRPTVPLATLPSFSGSGSDSRDDNVTADDSLVNANSTSSSLPPGALRASSDTVDGSVGGASLVGVSLQQGGKGVGERQARVDALGSAFMKLLMRQGSDSTTSHDSVFCGLRVRMGVATGKLPLGDDITRSGVFDLAKGEMIKIDVDDACSAASACR
jgi:hypothetical protein